MDFLAVLVLAAEALGATTVSWRALAPGMDLGTFVASEPSSLGDSRITVLRIDPERWELILAGTSLNGGKNRTARQWAADENLSAATNAGMFATDYKTHVGYMRFRGHVNSARVNEYQSVAAFDPRGGKELKPFRVFDLDEPDVSLEVILADYASAVQNLRLIKRPGLGRWSRQDKKWSEAALGEDDAGRILFIFCGSPFSMHQLNRELLSAGLGLVAAQHLEGGPEAQLYLRVGGEEIELFGSYETSFREDLANAAPWPVPNILGVRPRKAAGD